LLLFCSSRRHSAKTAIDIGIIETSKGIEYTGQCSAGAYHPALPPNVEMDHSVSAKIIVALVLIMAASPNG